MLAYMLMRGQSAEILRKKPPLAVSVWGALFGTAPPRASRPRRAPKLMHPSLYRERDRILE